MAVGLDAVEREAERVVRPAVGVAARHVDAFDGIRGLAVLAVMAAHVGLNDRGGCGVDIFFVLSGFLITGILLRERGQRGRVSFFNFYARRWLRLFPALLLTVLLFLVFARVMGLHMTGAGWDSLMALSYTSNWTRAFGNKPDYLGHTWSLSIEEQFYLLWPPVMLLLYRWLGRTWRGAAGCAALAAIVVAYRWWMIQAGATEQRIYNGLDTRLDTLLAGAARAFFMPRVTRVGGELLAWVSAGALTCFVAGWLGDSTEQVTLGTVGLLVGLSNAPAGAAARVLSLTPLVWVGKISYGLYLFHFPLMKYMIEQHWTVRDKTLVGISVAFALATASYYLVERPFLRLKDRFRGGRERGPGGKWIECSLTKGAG